jgi:hypothetical protein
MNMLEGAGLMQLIPQLLLLMSCFAICFGVALRTFKWR